MTKLISIESFLSYEDALMWIEYELEHYSKVFSDIKAELILIDGVWRASVITNTRQTEMEV